MSLIFDALKKADAARARTQAGQPGLHDEVVARSASVSPASVFDPQAPLRPAAPPVWARPRVAVWLVAGVLVLGALMLVFGPARRDDAPAPVAASAAAPAPAPVPMPAPDPSPPVLPPAAAPVPLPGALQGPAPAPQAPPPPPPPRAKAPPSQQPAVKAAPVATPAPTPSPTPAPTPAPSPAAPAPAAAGGGSPGSAPAAPAALPMLAELPPELRASLPRLSVSGAVYSPDPAARMLLVNGQVVREGEAVAPGLVLERIAPRQIVLSWQGTRFQMKL